MKLLRRLDEVSAGTVATIGNFDGVHRGHQALLAQLHMQADKMKLPVTVFLFEPQPGEYFHGQLAPARLTSLREKLQILKQCNVDYVYCLKFNKHLALMPAPDFAEHYFFSLHHVKYLLIGRDFRFGHARQGDVALLEELGRRTDCLVQTFPDFAIAEERVSSTKIRNALLQGQLEQATVLLGRTFSLCGRVIKGDGRGKQWGIPTANLGMHRLTLPLKGVFCVQVRRSTGELLKGVANIGSRPTVDGTKNILEIHLFDFNESLYGEMLQVFFLRKLRDEIKFSSVDALIQQIQDDVVAAKEQFKGALAFR
ncbi:riboflavin biosynthesis protein RibF (riboflavin kinase/FMN adenylyltransferase) [Legionella donaldsonii]|uniref:Riboflavin biosynthesis protein n=1 Tax=Legionella donaldsonii TaxID=45060 RepID=A0A378J5Q0_9GAMM|nr:bifunctional riboflavin kinase/FAD synthetase [Legionella donaldsonii]STX43082.1 riboflavin biosynthesis protein RibF (riboflavin kinase/FMN adenylyltransferase) [Legionella donaldsonii]